EEVVFRVQGYVLRSTLPPITSLNQINGHGLLRLTKNPQSAKQVLVLTGLGSKEFDDCIRAVVAIHSRFASHLPADALQPWVPVTDDGDLCLELSNRYFTPKHLAAEYEVSKINDDLDPLGLLKSRAGGLHHTEDNEVLYFERMKEPTAKYRYLPCSPITVKVGLLVEAQVSFCAVPISKGRFLMLSKLRSVCILDRQVYEVRKTYGKKRLKRKVGYGEEGNSEDDTTSQAMKKLKIIENGRQTMNTTE
ncbi:hypothetical protein BDY19DRAFT_900690, partial [Irpex rosettiformis]